MAESNIKVLTLQVDTGTGTIKVNGIKNSIEGATKAMNEFNATAAKTSAATKDLGSSAGLAGATVNEFGRFVSDLPYGITAVTNNISQLGSLFAILVTKTGSVNAAIKSLGATLRASPALVALLAFQALVAGIEYLAQSTRKATKSQDELGKAVGESAVELKIALKVLSDNNVSLEEKENLLIKVNSAYKDVNAQLGENEVLTVSSTKAIKEEIQQLQFLAQAQVLVGQAKTLYADLAIAEAKTNEESLNWLLRMSAKVAQATLPFDVFSNIVETTGKGFKDIATSNIEEEINKIVEQLKGFYDKIIKDSPTAGKTLKDLNLLIVQSQIEYLKSLDEVNEKDKRNTIDKITALNLRLLNIQEEASVKKAIEEKRSVDEMLILAESFAFKRAAIMRKSNSEALAMMRSFHSELKIDAQEAGENQYLELDFLTPLEDQIKKSTKAVASVMGDEQKRREKATENGNNAVSKLRQDDKIAAIWAAQDLSNGVFGVLEASFQREIDIERNKTNEKNNELRARLADENLSADERRNIQDRIASNDEALRKKQEKIEEKKFKLNKAASIANALVNTYLAASQALSDKTNPSTFAKIAATVAVIGVGLAQVAMIAKQKFVTSQSGLGGFAGSGSVGAGVQAPDFNIVGASPTNQIANAISENERKPIKAYVVSRDVSSAQEMDRNIIGVASLG